MPDSGHNENENRDENDEFCGGVKRGSKGLCGGPRRRWGQCWTLDLPFDNKDLEGAEDGLLGGLLGHRQRCDVPFLGLR